MPSPEESACLFSGSSPLFNVCYVPDLSICVPRLQDVSFPDVTETTLPVAKDKVLSFCDHVWYLPSAYAGYKVAEVGQKNFRMIL